MTVIGFGIDDRIGTKIKFGLGLGRIIMCNIFVLFIVVLFRKTRFFKTSYCHCIRFHVCLDCRVTLVVIVVHRGNTNTLAHLCNKGLQH